MGTWVKKLTDCPATWFRISEGTATTQFVFGSLNGMRFSGMLIHGRRCLGAAVALRVIEIHGGVRVRAENAIERNAAVHRLRGVVPHTFIVVLVSENCCVGPR
jgi:hypothetical protein